MRFDVLPDGVVPIRDYRLLGGTLCECHHDGTHRRVWKGKSCGPSALESVFCGVCKGSLRHTDGFRLPVLLIAEVPDVPALF